MKAQILAIFILLSLNSCINGQDKLNTTTQKITVQPEDKGILDQVFKQFSTSETEPISVLMSRVGAYFLGTPYKAQTLESAEEEHLIINLREFDCTTYVESILAISRAIKSGNPDYDHFCTELQNIRYRNGEIDGYPSRLHYFTDWIYDNEEKNLLRNISMELSGTEFPKEINFMSTHPKSYSQLQASRSFIKIISEQEKEISSREMYFVPETEIGEMENKLQDGDIVGITTNIKGLDILHVGLIVRKEGRIHLMHASSQAQKVEVSEISLEEYLLQRKTMTGIMVLRIL